VTLKKNEMQKNFYDVALGSEGIVVVKVLSILETAGILSELLGTNPSDDDGLSEIIMTVEVMLLGMRITIFTATINNSRIPHIG